MTIELPLRCNLSGLPIGTIKLATTIGTGPYMAHWNEACLRHPVFSLAPLKLYEFARNEWTRLAKSAADEEISYEESNTLCVSFLAILHSLDSIQQDAPALPALGIVQSNLQKVLALSYWKHYLESQRFRFPTLHISKTNKNTAFENIGDYLELCFEVRNSYETRISEAAEEHKARVAREAAEALTREWIAPVSKKVLWAWVRHYLPERYAADAQGWMNTLFLGGGNAIIEFQEEDLQMMEDIITGECPAGTGVMHAVRGRIATIWKTWRDHHETFAIDLEDYAVNQGVLVNGEQVAMPHPGEEPTLASCEGNKTKWIIAGAKWKIAMAAWKAQNRESSDPAVNLELGEI